MTQHDSWPGQDGPPEKDEVEEAEVEEAEQSADEDTDGGGEPQLRIARQHAAGDLDVPDDIDLLEGEARDSRRGVGIVVSRANVEIANELLGSALDELEKAGVARDDVMVMAVPGAFELPLGAMALAKTRRYACIVAIGCVIRGETPHFEYVSGEAASGLQLAALETGVPVAFGLLTVDTAADKLNIKLINAYLELKQRGRI